MKNFIPADRFSGIGKHICNEFLDILFPHICCFCNKIIADDFYIKGICRECMTFIPFRSKDNLIISCIDKHLNSHPMKYSKANIPVYAACKYEDPLKKALLDLKFYEASYYREFFAYLLVFVFSDEIKNHDCIIPVPLHKNRKKERGYNQSELIAEKISEITGIELYKDILLREKYTQRQSEMKTESDRAKNVSDVFFCESYEKILNKKILLLDDVLTSGSTMCYAANALLLSAGNEGNIKISGIVAASGR